MRYLSLFSGIEAATVAWEPLGWEPVAFAEVEKFPSAVLAHHYPHVPNLGDVTKHKEWPDLGPVDLVCGGSPCQSFSVAGLRKGMDDPRGNLALVYLAIVDRLRPSWVIFENVPGLLSSNGGRDFGSFLGALGQLGYGWAYRVLDAQYVRVDGYARAVPQRRRRVFVVGYLGDWRRAAAVLLEPEGMRGDPPPRRKAGQRPAPTLAARPSGGGGLGTDFDLDGGLIVDDAARCVTAGYAQRLDWETENFVATRDVAATLTRGAESAGRGGYAGRRQEDDENLVAHAPAIAFNARQDPDVYDGYTGPLDTDGSTQAVALPWAVRRLTPTECERLMGFPEIKKSLYIEAWKNNFSDHQKSYASAAIQNLKSLRSALNADASELMPFAPIAAQRSNTPHPGQEKRAVLNVQMNLERMAVEISSPEKSNWSVNIAEHLNSSLLPMPVGDFARLIAHIFTIQEKIMSDGKAASLANTSNSSHHLSGKPRNVLYGQESGVSASDAALFMKELDALMKSTTSGVGLNSQTLERILLTSLSFATSVISSCIPNEITSESSFGLNIEAVRGYTAIPWRGKPASECPDGPRYKALGNSFAVNVVRWIGMRIQMVEEIVREAA